MASGPCPTPHAYILTHLNWVGKKEDDKLIPVLSLVAPAPDSVLQLVRYKCGATNMESKRKCSGRCSCKLNSLVCIDLCACEGDDDKCTNMEESVIGEDIDDDI